MTARSGSGSASPAPGRLRAVGMEAASPAMQWALMGLFLLLASAVGAVTAVQSPAKVLLVLAALLPLPWILMDWRAGVVLLTLALPSATLLPPLPGLNLLNYLTGATLAAFTLKAAFSRMKPVGLPVILWVGFLLPAAWGMALAWPHLPEAVRNHPQLPEAALIYHPPRYLMDRFIKPVFYFFTYAFLLANAVRQSERPERFVALAVAALLLPSAAVFWTVARYPGDLSDLVGDREFMAPRGMHANEFGMQLALAAGPLLFVATAAHGARWRVLAWGGFAVAAAALVLTMSRGALLALLITVTGFLLHHRRVKTVVAGLVMGLLLWAAVPSELQDRFGTGLRDGALSDTERVDRDDLTAGRVHGWTLLAPEVLDHPMLGRGLGSTQWSSAVASGRYRANHPHNIYLELLMDLGLVGLTAFVVLHAGYLRRLRRRAREDAVPPVLRSYFEGVRWTFFGVLAMAATTAYYMPNPAQAPWWFALGLLFAFWNDTSPAPLAAAAAGGSPRGTAPARGPGAAG